MMNDQAEESGGKAVPKHLWAVGALALVWNGFGAMDYLMTQTRNDAYMSQFTPEQLEFFYGFPAWVVAFWAVAVWGSVLGSVLLLARRRSALTVFVVAFAAMVVTSVHNLEVSGPSGLVFSLVSFLVAGGLVLYALALRERGVLV